MAELYDAQGRPIPWSTLFRGLGLQRWADQAAAAEAAARSHPDCASAAHAYRQGEPLVLVGDAFDCLGCRVTFHAAGAAWTVPGSADHPLGPYAFCACCWRRLRTDPARLAEAVAVWRAEGVAVPADFDPAAPEANRKET